MMASSSRVLETAYNDNTLVTYFKASFIIKMQQIVKFKVIILSNDLLDWSKYTKLCIGSEFAFHWRFWNN